MVLVADDQSGTTSSLATVILTPVMVVLALAAVQNALWGHARTEARAVAHETAALVARASMGTADAARVAEGILDAQGDLSDVDVSIADDGVLVVVTVTALAPGFIRGTSAPVRVRAVLASEARP